MSSALVSARELADRLLKLPPGQLVVVPYLHHSSNPDDAWVEGELDGPDLDHTGGDPLPMVWGHEVRTGWLIIKPGEDCRFCDCPAETPDMHARLALLSDCGVDTVIETMYDGNPEAPHRRR